ncbi:hypothetical protein TgHK011_006217 [Trichoderma gracile]|nr:hypothetical protein TgHK011_006217 [Trichoderma gracile]
MYTHACTLSRRETTHVAPPVARSRVLQDRKVEQVVDEASWCLSETGQSSQELVQNLPGLSAWTECCLLYAGIIARRRQQRERAAHQLLIAGTHAASGEEG